MARAAAKGAAASAAPIGSDPRTGGTPRLGIAVLALSALTVFFAAFATNVDPDVWFHLRAGKEILAHGFLRTDSFSYPSAGRPYIDLHWLFQVVLYTVYRLAGEPGLVWFAALTATASFALVYRVARRHAGPALAAGLTVLGAVLASERFAPRPEILTFFFFALALWLVRRHTEGDRRAWWMLPLVTLLWVNTEGLFVLAYAAIGAALLDRPRDRRLWSALGLSVLASLVNPYFIQGALHPLVLFSRVNRSLPIYSATIGEFLSPFHGEPLHPSVLLLRWYLGLIGLGLVASRLRPRPSEIVLAAVFVYLAVSARRNVALLPIALTPVLARWLVRGLGWDPLAARWRRLAPAFRTRAGIAAAAAALVLMAGYDLGLVTNRVYIHAGSAKEFGAGRAGIDFPRKAAAFLHENRVPGPVFETFSAGSFFTFALPEQPVFIDGRLEVHSAEHYQEYMTLLQGGPAWAAADRKYGFNVAVIQYLDARNLAVERLRDPVWALVHIDENTVILVKRNAANEELIQREALNAERLYKLFPSFSNEQIAGVTVPPDDRSPARFFRRARFPWAQLNLAQLFQTFNRQGLAIPQLLEAIRIAPDRATPRMLLATSLNQAARPVQAMAALESAEQLGENREERATLQIVRGDILTAAGKPREAVEAYSAWLRHPASQAQAASVLASRGLARLRAGDPNGAAEDLLQSLRSQPGNAQAYWYLGMVEEARGRPAEARRAYEGFKALGGRSAEVDAALARLGG